MQISDINRNIARIKPTLQMVHWNEDAFKVGLCDVPPVRLFVPALVVVEVGLCNEGSLRGIGHTDATAAALCAHCCICASQCGYCRNAQRSW
jgi:hypothetical protein